MLNIEKTNNKIIVLKESNSKKHSKKIGEIARMKDDPSQHCFIMDEGLPYAALNQSEWAQITSWLRTMEE
jgi:hypothetical protein